MREREREICVGEIQIDNVAYDKVIDVEQEKDEFYFNSTSRKRIENQFYLHFIIIGMINHFLLMFLVTRNDDNEGKRKIKEKNDEKSTVDSENIDKTYSHLILHLLLMFFFNVLHHISSGHHHNLYLLHLNHHHYYVYYFRFRFSFIFSSKIRKKTKKREELIKYFFPHNHLLIFILFSTFVTLGLAFVGER